MGTLLSYKDYLLYDEKQHGQSCLNFQKSSSPAVDAEATILNTVCKRRSSDYLEFDQNVSKRNRTEIEQAVNSDTVLDRSLIDINNASASIEDYPISSTLIENNVKKSAGCPLPGSEKADQSQELFDSFDDDGCLPCGQGERSWDSKHEYDQQPDMSAGNDHNRHDKRLDHVEIAMLSIQSRVSSGKQPIEMTQSVVGTAGTSSVKDVSSESSVVKLPDSASCKAGNPNFVSEFYSNSRLHHLSTWGAEWRAYVLKLQTEGDSSFPGRQKLVDLVSVTGKDISKQRIKRLIMHIDMDCFFVSVGLKKRPHLRGNYYIYMHFILYLVLLDYIYIFLI